VAIELRERIDQQTAVVGVVGLGYVGLPLINVFIEAGFHALGFDVDPAKTEKLNRGQSYIEHLSGDMVQKWLDQQRFEATTDMARLAEPDVIIVCVPTPLTTSREPDLKYVEDTARMIGQVVRPGQLVVLESTTYPGTTRDVVLPLLTAGGHVTPGVDLFVAYSPEREDPGNAQFSTGTIPKVVGGIDPVSLDLANALYQHAVAQTVPVASCEVAEACKILENIYRSVNIAMVNELKVLFQKLNIDIWEVIDAAKTKPFGFQAFYPGPGLGGHCIPIDPFYLTWLARKHEMATRFIELAGEVNTSMPQYVIDRVAEALNYVGKPVRGSKVGLLGIAYKRDVDDDRESPSYKLLELLEKRGAVISYNDPHVPVLPEKRHYDLPRLASEELSPQWLASLDCCLISTDHSAYDWDEVVRYSKLVVDTRNATKAVAEGREKIWKA
jgi:UDP-N-acetyl-D-glucosamine dehydrogenase